MEERTARLEGINEQIRDRLNGIDRRFDSIDRRFDSLERSLELRFDRIEQRFTWLSGIVVGTWITTVLTILFHH